MGQPALEPAHADGGKSALDACVDLLGRDAHVQRPKGDVLENSGTEELVVGVLEDDADLGRIRPRFCFVTSMPAIDMLP
jgi:hypothetical protein